MSTSRTRPVRVLVADDQDLVRAGFRLLLDQVDDIEVVAEAADGEQAVREVRRTTPDVALMDIRMPRLDGLSATRRVVAETPGTRVVVLTTFDLDDYVYEALRAGACGFLLKSAPPERLVAAIRTAASGGGLLDPAVTMRVIEEFGRQPRPAQPGPELARLTEREVDVLHRMARGLSNSEIAGELVIAEATVKTHVARILAKLDVRDRVQAVVYAHEHGLVAHPRDTRA